MCSIAIRTMNGAPQPQLNSSNAAWYKKQNVIKRGSKNFKAPSISLCCALALSPSPALPKRAGVRLVVEFQFQSVF
jgi:hypothetical protein